MILVLLAPKPGFFLGRGMVYNSYKLPAYEAVS